MHSFFSSNFQHTFLIPQISHIMRLFSRNNEVCMSTGTHSLLQTKGLNSRNYTHSHFPVLSALPSLMDYSHK